MHKENRINKMVKCIIVLILLISFLFGFTVFSTAENTTLLQEVNLTVDDYTVSDELIDIDGTGEILYLEDFAATVNALEINSYIDDMEPLGNGRFFA